MKEAMNDHLVNWIDNDRSRLALRNTFGGSVPVLDDLYLAQLVIDGCSNVFISLNFQALPEGSPARWASKGCNSVQLGLSFCTSDLSLVGAAHEPGLEVRASFSPGRVFSMIGTGFRLELVYDQASADWYPYDSRIFEEPRDWYHR